MTPGNQTSEFKLSLYVFYAGIALDAVGVILHSLQAAGLNFGWMPTVMVVVGTLAALMGQLGYTRSRTMLKLQAQAPKAASEVAPVVPLVQEVLREVRAQRHGLPTIPSGSMSLPPDNG